MDNSKEQTFTIEEASQAFDRISAPFIAIEESFDIDRTTIPAQAAEMRLIERAIISDNVFSENEEYDEINEETIKFLFLPYVRAKLFFNANEDRLSALDMAKGLFKSYLNLCDHYGVLPAEIKSALDRINKDSYKPDREEKIRVYRASKAAEEVAEAADVKYKQGSLKQRELWKALLALKCFQALTDIEIIPQEVEMLKFRQRLQTDNVFKDQYEAEMNKPRPKPYFHKIDDGSGKDGAQQISAADVKQAKPLVTTETYGSTKLNVLDTLWQPDHAQPKMKMDDFGDLEYRLMMEKAERDKAHQKGEDEKMDRLNDEEKDELQKYKDRVWDDWKDAHEKGAGNKNY